MEGAKGPKKARVTPADTTAARVPEAVRRWLVKLEGQAGEASNPSELYSDKDQSAANQHDDRIARKLGEIVVHIPTTGHGGPGFLWRSRGGIGGPRSRNERFFLTVRSKACSRRRTGPLPRGLQLRCTS
jgi:hypothetical protein